MARPAALHPGDRVSVIAPASSFDRPAFERGLALLATRYQPVVRPDIYESRRYLAGGDDRRLAELSEALSDPTTSAIFCARGGYGVTRLLSRLQLPRRAKPLIGFSDITALHGLAQSRGRVSVHGPVLTQLGRLGEAVANELFELLETPSARVELRGEPQVPGVAEGRVVGGNLSVLTRLLGTPYLPPLEGAILFLEDVGERPYRLDRMWQHLALAGAFEKVKGIALGEFVECEEKGGKWTAAEILRELAEETGLPCVAELPVGHGDRNRPLPLGARARLDGAEGTLRFLEGAVR